jgi:hypothetical protein
VVAVGLFDGGGLVIGQFELERGDGFGQVMRFGRADDRGTLLFPDRYPTPVAEPPG